MYNLRNKKKCTHIPILHDGNSSLSTKKNDDENIVTFKYISGNPYQGSIIVETIISDSNRHRKNKLYKYMFVAFKKGGKSNGSAVYLLGTIPPSISVENNVTIARGKQVVPPSSCGEISKIRESIWRQWPRTLINLRRRYRIAEYQRIFSVVYGRD